MGAIRAARGFTGRDHIMMIEGGFHGAHDAALVKAGSGAATMGIPGSSGVPADVARLTLQVPFNDIDALEKLLRDRDDIACLIMEPVMGNMGPILPRDGYLQAVREVTREHDVLLIFDEVITGFRIGLSGAQGYYGVRPDLTTLGKIAGGGLPLGVFGGRREIMERVAPAGDIYQAGTFNGNPLSLAAGMATVDFLKKAGVHAKVNTAAEELRRSIAEIARDAGIKCSVGGIASMFQIFFGELPGNYADALRCDVEKYRRFWRVLLENGVFLPPSQFETCFVSWAHDGVDLERTQEACKKALGALR
jgi:glutamate-1-semialdehyde 2,1-aminomutase